VVEVDGAHHFSADGRASDDERTAYLTARGLKVLRFGNAEVLGQPEIVLGRLRAVLALTPGPSPERGEG
jgi:very-short-patch-repair endonuclease